MEIVFQKDWIKIFRSADKYIIQYNSGDLINSIGEIEVSEADAKKAQINDQNAYEVIVKYQKY